MQNKFKKLICTLITAGICGTVFAAPNNNSSDTTSETQSSSSDKVVLNFEDADIQTVIKAISKLSGKNFVIDPRVKGKVNIISEKPVTKTESYKVLEGALRMQGYATVEADGVIKVLPEADAKTHDMVTGIDGNIKYNQGDQLVTKIFTIDNGSATQISNSIRPLVSSNNSISVYPGNNSLIVTDYASNIARITKIINGINATEKTKIPPEVVKLKHAYAADVANLLQSYQGVSAQGGSVANADSGPIVNITVNPAGNSLILSSNNKNKLEEVKALALSLDTENATSNNNMHVVYLKNADAAHVAQILNVIASGQSDPDITPSPAQRTLSDTSSAFATSGSGGSGGAFNGSSNPQPTKSSSSSQANNANADKNAPKILIQAEPTTNSLIIQAPEAVYRNLRSIIDMLDVRRVQVMIEALIADINATENGSFGIQWIGGAGNNKAGAGVLSNYGGNGSSISSIATTALGLASTGAGSPMGGVGIPQEVYVGLVTGTVEVGGQKIPGISALADMITASSAGNVLGRPTLLTLDNEEASLFVGQNIGITTGSYATTGGNSTVNPFNTVDRKDVGTVLRIKPLVTQSGAIQLSVYQEDSKLDPNSMQPTGVFAQSGPNILKRNLKTQLIVDDGQIIALGGMTEDVVSLQMSGIPLLSSIPYLGWIFSWQSRAHAKRNLVIFLRPLIIRNEEGAKALTNQRYRYILDQQKSVHAEGNILLPEIKAVTFENQVPYDAQQLPAQKFTPPNQPMVDLRGMENNAPSQPLYREVNGNTTVQQNSPSTASVITTQQ